MKPNESQKEAIKFYQGPCLVLAGPGSGKTYTIAKRIDTLINKHQVRPEEILVITFSKASSIDMKKRFETVAEKNIFGVTFGTFHGVFYNILKTEKVIGAKALLSEKDRMMIISDILKEIDNEYVSDQEDEKELLAEISTSIANVKNELLHTEKIEGKIRNNISLKSVFIKYEAIKKENEKIDFEDMISMLYEYFSQNENRLKLWQDRFKYILVDEFQDVNMAQYEVLNLLAKPNDNLFVVGDDDQSIYQFRGATPNIMKKFLEDYKHAVTISLNVNYRSTKYIVVGALRVISHNRARFKKEIEALSKVREPVHVQEVRDASEEASYIIEEIKKKKRVGIPLTEVSILYRTVADVRAIHQALLENNIPFNLKDYIPDIYEHFIAKDILAYLKIATGDMKRQNFLRIINKPLRYLSRSSLDAEIVDFQKLIKAYRDKEWMRDRILGLEWDIKTIAIKKTPYTAIAYIREKVGYNNYINEYAKERNINRSVLMGILDELQDLSEAFNTIEEMLSHVDNRRMKFVN
ncbi:MAG: ATP-dependent helicase, partial [Suipraeoptans sp.]